MFDTKNSDLNNEMQNDLVYTQQENDEEYFEFFVEELTEKVDLVSANTIGTVFCVSSATSSGSTWSSIGTAS